MKDTKNVIGDRISVLLSEKNKKQKDLAEFLNVTANTISYYVTGARIPNIDQIIKIADFFNVSTDYLLGRTEVETIDTDLKAVCNYMGLKEQSVRVIRYYVKNVFSEYLTRFLLSKKSYNFYKLLTNYIVVRTTEELIATDENYKRVPLRYSFQDSKIAFADIIEELPRLKSEFKTDIENEANKKTELCLEYLSMAIDTEKCREESRDFYGIFDEDLYDVYQEYDSWEDFAEDIDIEEEERQLQKEIEEYQEESFKRQGSIDFVLNKLIEYKKKKGAETHGDNPEEK